MPHIEPGPEDPRQGRITLIICAIVIITAVIVFIGT